MELDEIVSAHRGLGGSGRGRRFATLQINYAYAVLLASQFQGFCRDLHSECTEHLVRHLVPTKFRFHLRALLTRGRKLDSGNANAGNIGADFGSFIDNFWDEVKKLDKRNQERQNLLDELNVWRNAIAHQNFTKGEFIRLSETRVLRLQQVRKWRSACDQLAATFDQLLCQHLCFLTGTAPW